MYLPEDFCLLMREQLGADEAEGLLAALEDEPPVSVRLNEAKPSDVFSDEPEKIKWCRAGRYLSQRPQFTLDPYLHAGCYYVQEASSMSVQQAFRALPDSPKRVLDLCAAPGGKSTLWASLLQEGSLLVCNEPVRSRANILAENLAKWGYADAVVTNAYPADFAPLEGFFDVVAADVPCSGEGMFRKDHGARAEWSMANVRMCAERQFEIVRDVWPALCTGGYLIYSTCTFNRLEDEDNVKRICAELGAEPVKLNSLLEYGSYDDDGRYGVHFYPHRVRGEGFFIAMLKKACDDGSVSGGGKGRTCAGKKGRAQANEPPAETRKLISWLQKPDDFRLMATAHGTVAAIRKCNYDDVVRLLSSTAGRKVMSVGVELAVQKGRKWQPLPEAALSSELSDDAFSRAELDYNAAIAYLRHEAITLPADAPRGYVLVCYRGHSLGFVNNLGTRANNLYPAEWRIRKII